MYSKFISKKEETILTDPGQLGLSTKGLVKFFLKSLFIHSLVKSYSQLTGIITYVSHIKNSKAQASKLVNNEQVFLVGGCQEGSSMRGDCYQQGYQVKKMHRLILLSIKVPTNEHKFRRFFFVKYQHFLSSKCLKVPLWKAQPLI